MSTQKLAPLKGGKYIGKGTYGCAFDPPIRCEEDARRSDSKSTYKNAVGKVFMDDEAFKEESELLKRLERDQLDPTHRFTVKLRKVCKTAPPRASDLKNAAPACADVFSQSSASSRMQLILDDGGQNLKSWALQPRKDKARAFIQLVRKLGPVLKGLMGLVDKGWVHGDIKAANVLVKHAKVSLIDFGIAETRDRIFRLDRDWILNFDYPTFPIEYKAYMHLFNSAKHMDVSPQTLEKEFEKNMTHLKDWKTVFQIVGIQWQQQLETFALKLQSVHPSVGRQKNPASLKSLQQLFHDFTRSIDSYGLGVALLDVYATMGLASEKTGKKQLTSMILIYSFLQRLADPNPFTRYNIYQAYSHYLFILPLL